jgi:hypothetical protein
MPTYKILMGCGTALATLMVLLMGVGTRSLALFVIFFILMVVGAGMVSVGQRMRDRR